MKYSTLLTGIKPIISTSLLLIMGISMIHPSCKKTESENLFPASATNSIPVDHGCLVFADQTAFDSMITVTENFRNNEISDFQQQFTGTDFISAASCYQQAKKELDIIQTNETFEDFPAFASKWGQQVQVIENGYTIKPKLDFPFLQNLINTKGMVKIGNQYLRFYNHALLICPESRYEDLSELDKVPANFEDPEMVMLPIERTKLSDMVNVLATDRDQTITGVASTNGSNNGSKRITGEVSVTTVGSALTLSGTSGCGSNGTLPFVLVTFRDRVTYHVKSEEKKWWGWKDYSSNLSISGSGSVRNTVSGGSQSFALSPPLFLGYSEINLSNSYTPSTSLIICPGTPYANYIFGSGTSISCSSTAVGVTFGI